MLFFHFENISYMNTMDIAVPRSWVITDGNALKEGDNVFVEKSYCDDKRQSPESNHSIPYRPHLVRPFLEGCIHAFMVQNVR